MSFRRGSLILLSFLPVLLFACSDSVTPGVDSPKDGGRAFDGAFDPDATSFVLKRLEVDVPGLAPIFVDLVGSNLQLDPTEATVSIDVAVRNSGSMPLYGPATIWLGRFAPPEVAPLNPDYVRDHVALAWSSVPLDEFGYDYSDLLGEDDMLAPNEQSASKSWVFHDPGLASFSFGATAEFALVADRPVIAGVLFADENRNGLRDPSESPYFAGGVRVEYPDGTEVFASPDPDGVYRVRVEEPGLHSVRFVSMLACVACWCVTTPDPLEVLITAGPDGQPQSFEDADIGIYSGSCFDPPHHPGTPVLLTDTPPDSIEQDFYQLLSAELVGERLALRVGFSGCGPELPFTLYAGVVLRDPYPAKTWVLLSHESPDPTCAAYWERTLLFDLHPVELAHIQQYGAPGEVRLFFRDFEGLETELLLEPVLEEVTGSVLHIQDDTPVDGGVTIELQTGANQITTLLFSSLFTEPPPPPWREEMYQLIVALGVGDVVWAAGVRIDEGISLRELAVAVR